eukprot:3158111-Prymnesium_polylepis.3
MPRRPERHPDPARLRAVPRVALGLNYGLILACVRPGLPLALPSSGQLPPDHTHNEPCPPHARHAGDAPRAVGGRGARRTARIRRAVRAAACAGQASVGTSQLSCGDGKRANALFVWMDQIRCSVD